MNALRAVTMPTAALILSVAMGCASPPRAVPTGEWVGQGTYVACEALAKKGTDEFVQSRSQDGVYDTSLKISKEQMFGREVLVFEILSKRGKLLNSDDTETRIKMILTRTATLSTGAELYALADWSYGKGPHTQPNEGEFQKRTRAACASCIYRGGTAVLQVYYIVPSKKGTNAFLDTFVFEAGRVRKYGSLAGVQDSDGGEKPGQDKFQGIYWTEELRKAK
jgi:hypothetical protein